MRCCFHQRASYNRHFLSQKFRKLWNVRLSVLLFAKNKRCIARAVTMSSSIETPVAAPPTVVVIGCGPGGMFFLHALATKRRALRAKGDEAGVEALPVVTCFEHASVPGGVWRARTGTATIINNPSAPAKAEVALKKQRREDPACPHEEKKDDCMIEESMMRGLSISHTDSTSQSTEEGEDEQNEESDSDESDSDESDSDESDSDEEEEEGDFTIGEDRLTPPSANMYEALWTNGPKEAIEFPDYTFDEHFGHALPIYMPRQALLEYMQARVTRHEPTFFDEFVRFNTTVGDVKYDEDLKKFVVVSSNNVTGETTTEYYDKCVWAAGLNGRPFIPKAMSSILVEGKFLGKAMHSSNMGDFDDDIRGKNVLFIGDSYSSEDLALTAIKRGVKKVYICSRSGEGAASYMGAWPMNKVEVLKSSTPTAVINNGKGIRCERVEYSFKSEKYEIVENADCYDMEDISTIIFCTGYRTNMTMLDKSLREEVEDYDTYMQMPKDWKMKENNQTEELGHVPPSKYIYPSECTLTPGLFRGALMSNPNMMFVTQVSDVPLMEIDVGAWMMLGFVTGEVELPAREEMERINRKLAIAQMDNIFMRGDVDTNYDVALSALPDEHWSNDILQKKSRENEHAYGHFVMRLVAELKKVAGYPHDIGDFEKLNEKGEKLVEMNIRSGYDRYTLDPKNKDENSWRTFRDVADPEENVSIHTGTKAVKLKCRWMDLDDTDDNVHIDPAAKLSK
eukprot:scaffold35153_cov48-Attheya_sp.AAC.1